MVGVGMVVFGFFLMMVILVSLMVLLVWCFVGWVEYLMLCDLMMDMFNCCVIVDEM